jgi:hypothetical protein
MAMVEVTDILSRIELGDPTAAEHLLPLIYQELPQLAVARLSHENPGKTLQATALVHEAYLRLVGSGECEPQQWNSRQWPTWNRRLRHSVRADTTSASSGLSIHCRRRRCKRLPYPGDGRSDSPALQGDFNGNGVVDAADYVVWRKGLGASYTQNDYNVWRAHFAQTLVGGATSTSLNSSVAVVPEPGTSVLFLSGLLTLG